MSGDDIFSDDWGLSRRGPAEPAWDGEEARNAERAFIRGVELHRAGKIEDAVNAYNTAVRLDPKHLQALNNLAVLLRSRGALPAAEAAYRRALAEEPNNPGFRFNLGNVLRDRGAYKEAYAEVARALEIDGDEAEYHAAFGLLQRDLGQFEGALASLEKAHALKPNLRNIAVEWAATYLAAEDYQSGFAALWEWQRSIADASRFAGIPLWRGEPLNGRTLLLQAEPSDADNILYARYVPYAARLAKEKARDPEDPGTVVLESLQGMTQLFSAMRGVDLHLTRGAPGPSPDLRFPLMCLPGLFQTSIDQVPRKTPYIRLPAGRPFELPGAESHTLSVSLVWEGGGAARNTRLTSLPLGELLPLTALSDVGFYSLQKGPPAVDLTRHLAGGLIRDLSSSIDDYLDVARVVEQLDLVIAVDSGAAHLAAALGRPVWLLADYACDWRWRRAGETTPWYPTARVFRQNRPGEWGSVVAEVERSLAQELERKRQDRRA